MFVSHFSAESANEEKPVAFPIPVNLLLARKKPGRPVTLEAMVAEAEPVPVALVTHSKEESVTEEIFVGFLTDMEMGLVPSLISLEAEDPRAVRHAMRIRGENVIEVPTADSAMILAWPLMLAHLLLISTPAMVFSATSASQSLPERL